MLFYKDSDAVSSAKTNEMPPATNTKQWNKWRRHEGLSFDNKTTTSSLQAPRPSERWDVPGQNQEVNTHVFSQF